MNHTHICRHGLRRTIAHLLNPQKPERSDDINSSAYFPRDCSSICHGLPLCDHYHEVLIAEAHIHVRPETPNEIVERALELMGLRYSHRYNHNP